MEFFVSYNHLDKQLAGQIGKLLEKSGQTAFLAHDDIKPTVQWEGEIMRRLDTCTAIVAVITPNFRGSDYANQEVGFTMGKVKPVIPLRFNNSELPGFVKSSQAITTSQDTLNDAIRKVVETAEEKMSASFVRPKQFLPLAELIDLRLEQRREPYWRVSAKPQGFVRFIPKSSESDAWFSQPQNRPEFLLYMDSRPTSNGWTFGPKSTRFSEVTDTGEFCYGRAISADEEIYIQTGIRLLTQLIAYEIRLLREFKFNPVQQTYISAELKLGLAYGHKMNMSTHSISWDEPHTTDEQEVIQEKSLLLEEWEKDSTTPVESMVILFCRSFGISLSTSDAKKLVSSALSQ